MTGAAASGGRREPAASLPPRHDHADVIHHLVPAGAWNVTDDPYAPSSLVTEGFIHFSTADQLTATAQRYYRDVADLLVVTVAVEALAHALRWENLAGTGVFPHLYGPLNIGAVLRVRPYRAADFAVDG